MNSCLHVRLNLVGEERRTGCMCEVFEDLGSFILQPSSHLHTVPPVGTWTHKVSTLIWKLFLLLWSSWKASPAMSRTSHEVCFSFLCAVCQRSIVALLCQWNSYARFHLHRTARRAKVKKNKQISDIPPGQNVPGIQTGCWRSRGIAAGCLFKYFLKTNRCFERLLMCSLCCSHHSGVPFSVLVIEDGASAAAAVRPSGRPLFSLYPQSWCSGL